MKKRYSCLFIALIVAISCVLSGCPGKKQENTSSTAATSEDKELFMSALGDEFTNDEQSQNDKFNYKGDLTFEEFEEQYTFNYDITADSESFMGLINLAGGEDIMPIEIAGNKENLYYRFNDIMEDFDFLPINDSDEETQPEVSFETAVIFSALENISAIKDKFTDELQSDKFDSFFELAPGSDESSKIITLTLTNENMGTIEGFEDTQYTLSLWVFHENETTKVQNANGCMSFVQDEKNIELIFDMQDIDNKIEINAEILAESEALLRATFINNNIDGKSTIDFDAKFTPTAESEFLNIDFALDYTESEVDNGSGKFNMDIKYSDEPEISYFEQTKIAIPFVYKKTSETGYYFCIENIEEQIDGEKNTYNIKTEITADQKESAWEIGFDLDLNIEFLNIKLSSKTLVTPTETEIVIPENTKAYEGDISNQLFELYPDIFGFEFSDDDFNDDYLTENDFSVENNHDFYDICYDGTGFYHIGYTLKSNENGKAVLLLDNGETMELEYEYTPADEEGFYNIIINGKEFSGDTYRDEFETFYDHASSKESALFNGEEFSVILFDCYGEIGTISARFTYTEDNDVYTITHADGTIETRTLVYDEEYDLYYFDDQIAPAERYLEVYVIDDHWYFDLTNNTCDFSTDMFYEEKDFIVLKNMFTGDEYQLICADISTPEGVDGNTFEINGMPARISTEKFDNYDIVMIEIYNQCDCGKEHPIFIYYTTDNEFAAIDAQLCFEKEGDNISITLPDGTVLEKTIVYNEEMGEYTFG